MHIWLGLYDVTYLNKETKCPELLTRMSLETGNTPGYTFTAKLLTCTFCNIFDLQAIVGLENQFSVLLRVAVLRRFYCIVYYLLVLRNCYLEVDFLSWDLYIQYPIEVVLYYLLVLHSRCYLEVDFLARDLCIQCPYCGGVWYYTTY